MVDETPRDYAQEPPTEGRAFEQHVKSRSTWLRLVFMIVIWVLYELTRVVTAVVAVLQFLHVLFTGETNPRLKDFGSSLATYTQQMVSYLTFNTEVRPFPFDAGWPPPGTRD
jgi:Flp pilus assembly protein TadB